MSSEIKRPERKTKVLVVDDDKIVLRAVSEILQREGYQVVALDDAVEGLSAVKDPSIDVACLDIKMPNLSGMDLLKAFKQSRPDVEVIMMTAFATVQTAVEAMKLGAYDYIQKPFDGEEIKALVERTL
ncbi:MAG: response regulator, partial [Archangium sp.]